MVRCAVRGSRINSCIWLLHTGSAIEPHSSYCAISLKAGRTPARPSSCSARIWQGKENCMNFRRIAFVAAAILVPGPALAIQGPALIPEPVSVELRSGAFTVSNGTGISASGPDAVNAAHLLAERVAVDRGLLLPQSSRGAIRIELDRSIKGDEAYRLTIDAQGIRIAAAANSGLIHGAMTL